MKKTILLIILILPNITAPPVFAYIGPGMGGGVLAGIIGVVGAIFLALFGILYYPIKRLIKKIKKNGF